jgi:undecaprenyl-diphosphatase
VARLPRPVVIGLLSLVCFALVAAGVGIHPPEAAPTTSVAAIGVWDQAVHDRFGAPVAGLFSDWARGMDVLGSWVVVVPLWIALIVTLLVVRRWQVALAVALTWGISEAILRSTKAAWHRDRPPLGAMASTSFAFPSGHTVAAAAIGVSLAFAFTSAGSRRRTWTIVAIVVAAAMGLSRIQLDVHWFSDTLAGVLLGAGVALVCMGFALPWRQPEARMTIGRAFEPSSR